MATPRDPDTHTQQDKVTAPFMPLCLCCSLPCQTANLFLSCAHFRSLYICHPPFLHHIQFHMFQFPNNSVIKLLSGSRCQPLCQPHCYLIVVLVAIDLSLSAYASLSLWAKSL